MPIEPKPDGDGGAFGTGARRRLVIAVLAAAMGLGIVPLVAIGVLAPFLIDDFGISRADVGLLVAVVSGVSAILSPAVGRLVDGLGDRGPLLCVLALGLAGLLCLAAAPNYAVMVMALGLGGLCRAGCNPVTNRVITLRISRGNRGWITGVKQSGETVAVVLAGGMLPALALLWGWRTAVLGLAVLAAAALLTATLCVEPAPAERIESEVRGDHELRQSIAWLNAYNLAMGAAGGAVTAYFPLYAHQEGHLGVAAAGGLMVLAGAVGGLGRILWSHWSESRLGFPVSLSTLAALAVLSGAIMVAAPELGPAAFWVSAGLWGASGLAFGSVAMLAVMAESDGSNTGRASGLTVFWFGVGFTIAPPLFGWLADHSDGYGIGFSLVAATYLAAAALILYGRASFRALT